jgi:hypothetical protein
VSVIQPCVCVCVCVCVCIYVTDCVDLRCHSPSSTFLSLSRTDVGSRSSPLFTAGCTLRVRSRLPGTLTPRDPQVCVGAFVWSWPSDGRGVGGFYWRSPLFVGVDIDVSGLDNLDVTAGVKLPCSPTCVRIASSIRQPQPNDIWAQGGVVLPSPFSFYIFS